jgi:protein tyrosine/serine phosphatase
MLSLGLSMAGWAEYLAATGNIHTVIPNVLYRSAELSRSGFRHVIERFHIHTVINLRGANPGHPWYDNEVAAVLAAGARHVDLRMSATHVPSAAKLQKIEAALAQAQPPILIHCQGGADRSGLVAALYELWIAHRPAAKVSAQLSFAYGHFPWLGSRTAAMDEAWRKALQRGPR